MFAPFNYEKAELARKYYPPLYMLEMMGKIENKTNKGVINRINQKLRGRYEKDVKIGTHTKDKTSLPPTHSLSSKLASMIKRERRNPPDYLLSRFPRT